MNILVTGTTGFIGSHLIKKLTIEGHKVFLFDHSERCFQKVKIDAVIHLAAKAGIQPKLQNAIDHYNTNVVDTVNLLELCVKYSVKIFVFISSSSIYGNQDDLPTDENANTDRPLCHYAATKKAAEISCYPYHHTYGMNIACLRLFTVYGPRQKTEMAIPLFVKSIYHDMPITVFSNGYRDYVYIDDVITGIVCAVKNNKGYEVYNIGSGTKTSTLELIALIEELTEKLAEVTYDESQLGYSKDTCADIGKARQILGYAPKFTIHSGIKQYVEWYMGNMKNAIRKS